MNSKQQERLTRFAEGCVRRDLEAATFFRTHFERYTAEVEKERQQLLRLLRDRNKRLRKILLIINGAKLTHTAQTRDVETKIRYYCTRAKVRF